MRRWDDLSSRMESEVPNRMPTEADLDRTTDETYERERDEFCVASIIEKAKRK